jgi:hypothetical protein
MFTKGSIKITNQLCFNYILQTYKIFFCKIVCELKKSVLLQSKNNSF